MTAVEESTPTAITPDRFWRWPLERYHRLIRSGILEDLDQYDMLEGLIFAKPIRTPLADQILGRLYGRLSSVVPAVWQVRTLARITLADSEPEPDATIARGLDRNYAERHPDPSDIGLVVEISDASLEIDRDWKGRIYARAALPAYWIINLVDRQVEVYTDPRPGDAVPAYATRTDHRPGDAVPLVLDGQTVAHIPVDDLLG